MRRRRGRRLNPKRQARAGRHLLNARGKRAFQFRHAQFRSVARRRIRARVVRVHGRRGHAKALPLCDRRLLLHEKVLPRGRSKAAHQRVLHRRSVK